MKNQGLHKPSVQKHHKKSNNSENCMDDDHSSEWSLSSLEDLKGLDIKELNEEDEEPKQPKHEKPTIKIIYPPKSQIKKQAQFFDIGKVISKVGDLLIVEANSYHQNVVDLDNWVYDEEHKCVGFVMDVFGRVDHPFYAIKPQETIDSSLLGLLIGKMLFIPEGSKTLTEDDIKSLQAKSSCLDQEIQSDSDEEIRDQEEEFGRRDRKRRESFDEREPFRSRQKHRRNKWKDDFQHQRRRKERNPPQQNMNQTYLQNMYSMYYNQMMQFYNGNGNLPMPPPFN